MKLRLLQGHPEAFARLRPLPSELEQKKKVLQRNQSAPMPPRRKAERLALLGVVRHDGL